MLMDLQGGTVKLGSFAWRSPGEATGEKYAKSSPPWIKPYKYSDKPPKLVQDVVHPQPLAPMDQEENQSAWSPPAWLHRSHAEAVAASGALRTVP